MTMLTHTRGFRERAPAPAASRDSTGAGRPETGLAMIKRAFMPVLVALAASAAVAAILVLRVAIYLPRGIQH